MLRWPDHNPRHINYVIKKIMREIFSALSLYFINIDIHGRNPPLITHDPHGLCLVPMILLQIEENLNLRRFM